jgi:peptidoglycan/xylan/chitin deacetylase (PgdA/CDA1 family)
VYQSTFYCSYRYPVFQGISSYILWKGRSHTADGLEFTGVPGKLNISEPKSRDRVAQRIWQHAAEEKMSVHDENHLVERLAFQLGVDFHSILDKRIIHLMNPEELTTLVQEGVDIQLHTHRHRTPRDRSLFLREIEDNRNFLRRIAPNSLTHFCYPSGDYDMRFLPWLESAGIQSAVTCDPGLAGKTTNPLILPRLIDTSSLSSTEFRGWLCGLSQFLPRR